MVLRGDAPLGNRARAEVLAVCACGSSSRGFFFIWGRRDRDFEERDRSLLELLQPHLLEYSQSAGSAAADPPCSPIVRRRCTGLVALGLTNGEIAVRLVLSRTTVRTHLENIFGKLDVHTRTAAVARQRELAAVLF